MRRPFPSQDLEHFDPLLMLDEMGPVVYAPGEAVGAPDHPHRGFETVTYLLDGEAEHADSTGHAGTLRAGDVQWMTAGAGVVHREMPSHRLQREGGRMHGFQLWVNLPRDRKSVLPRYQERRRSSIPVVTSPDGRGSGSVIAGEAMGTIGAVSTHTPIVYHHWRLQPGARVEVPLPADHRVCVYVFDGEVTVADRRMERGQLAVLGAGEAVALTAEGFAQALVLGGRPLGEPIAWGGPFVMCTREEVMQAFEDYRAGRMGRIPPEIVRA